MINPEQSVASIVVEYSACAAVLQRHRIDYCCRGESSLATACRDRRVDLAAVVEELERAIRERQPGDEDPRTLATPALVAHIVARYHVPLRKSLPFLRALAAKVARVHGEHNPRLVGLDAVVAELGEILEPHIDDEEKTLFPALAADDPDRTRAAALLGSMREEHAVVGELLGRMRAAAEGYAVPDWACNSYRTLFRELEGLEGDVLRHVHLENHVLLPRFA